MVRLDTDTEVQVSSDKYNALKNILLLENKFNKKFKKIKRINDPYQKNSKISKFYDKVITQ